MRHLSRRKRVMHVLEYALALSVRELFRHLPLPVALGVGELLGAVLYVVFRLRRRVALRNLELALPHHDPRDRARTALTCYRHMGLSLAEFICMDRWVKRGVRFANLSHVRELLAQGKGLVLATAHFGNWEAFAAASALQGIPITAVARTQRNRRVAALINDWRRAHGMEVVPATRVGLKHARNALQRGRVVAFLADQDAGRRGVRIDFLGVPASATPIPMALARRMGAPLVPGYIVRTGRARHVVDFEDAIPPEGGTPAVQMVADSLARRIRSRPELYFWAHRRWKTKPTTGTPGHRDHP